MPLTIRGNQIITISRDDWDPCWNSEDRARYLTLVARFQETLPTSLIDCVVWKRKFPGLQYNADVENLMIEALQSPHTK